MNQLIRAFTPGPGFRNPYAVLTLTVLSDGRASIDVRLDRREVTRPQRPGVGIWNTQAILEKLYPRCGFSVLPASVRDSADGEVTEGTIAIQTEGMTTRDIIDRLDPLDDAPLQAMFKLKNID